MEQPFVLVLLLLLVHRSPVVRSLCVLGGATALSPPRPTTDDKPNSPRRRNLGRAQRSPTNPTPSHDRRTRTTKKKTIPRPADRFLCLTPTPSATSSSHAIPPSPHCLPHPRLYRVQRCRPACARPQERRRCPRWLSVRVRLQGPDAGKPQARRRRDLGPHDG